MVREGGDCHRAAVVEALRRDDLVVFVPRLARELEAFLAACRRSREALGADMILPIQGLVNDRTRLSGAALSRSCDGFGKKSAGRQVEDDDTGCGIETNPRT